jgi:hypothetical protein
MAIVRRKRPKWHKVPISTDGLLLMAPDGYLYFIPTAQLDVCALPGRMQPGPGPDGQPYRERKIVEKNLRDKKRLREAGVEVEKVTAYRGRLVDIVGNGTLAKILGK